MNESTLTHREVMIIIKYLIRPVWRFGDMQDEIGRTFTSEEKELIRTLSKVISADLWE